MPTREDLESHLISTLKKEVAKTNIIGFSKLKKSDLIDLMLKHKHRFHHIKKRSIKTYTKIPQKVYDEALKKKKELLEKSKRAKAYQTRQAKRREESIRTSKSYAGMKKR
tara:strand:+ start:720 stop:1049 length:330 start_codon:yes stop_codon:yes gene_type:complete